MKKTILKFYIAIVLVILSFLIGCCFILYCTSAEVWYAGMHDEECEGENCGCYQRFLANEKENLNQ